MLRSFFLSALLVLTTALPCIASGVTVEQYDIEIPDDFLVPYTGTYANQFPDGFTIGIGSGLCYIGRAKDGARVFYAISDRGPNANAPKYEENGKTVKTKM